MILRFHLSLVVQLSHVTLLATSGIKMMWEAILINCEWMIFLYNDVIPCQYFHYQISRRTRMESCRLCLEKLGKYWCISQQKLCKPHQ